MSPNLPHELPFTVRIVRTEEDLRRAVAVRADALRERLPEADGIFVSPEEEDFQPNTVLLLAASQRDGSPLGSLRMMTSERGKRLTVERALELPETLRGQSIAEASRLAVRADRGGTVVRMMLWKAFHRYCLAMQINRMLIAVRDSEVRLYESFGFADAVPGGLNVSSGRSGAEMRRVLTLGVFEPLQRAEIRAHPLYDFFFTERHAEIEVFSSVASRWNAPRVRTQPLPDHARIAEQLEKLAFV
ncbi:MAG: hypothetical protein J0H09_13330 [Burkholderiales bacterium]|nr:hypothetical protein [Burkholderiales bacterium]